MKENFTPPGINRDVVAFVMARWQKSGGFGFAPTLPASIEDTYHAVRILETIRPVSENEFQELRENPALKTFLTRQEDRENWSVRTAYHYLMLCAFYGLGPDQGWLRRFLGKKQKAAASLRDRYDLARILKELPYIQPKRLQSGVTDAARMNSSIIPDGGLPSKWRTADDLWMTLVLHKVYAKPFPTAKDDLIQWLQACQSPDGGFGFLPGTTSFIENCHFCLRALALLGGGPRDPDPVRDFILRCRTRGGGFARINGGAPFLSATWHAVASLELLVNSAPFAPAG